MNRTYTHYSNTIFFTCQYFQMQYNYLDRNNFKFLQCYGSNGNVRPDITVRMIKRYQCIHMFNLYCTQKVKQLYFLIIT